MTFVSVFLIDRVGRRLLLLVSLFGIVLILILVGAVFHLNEAERLNKAASGWILLFFVMSFMCFL